MKLKYCSQSIPFLLLFIVAIGLEIKGTSAHSLVKCRNPWSPCYGRVIVCPWECLFTRPFNPKARACVLDCNSPKCEAVCQDKKPCCHGKGSGCGDPRFIGGDGVVFYFHGRKGQHFSLVSDPNIQINARFIGLRPSGRTRDFTWIQALGLMFGLHTLAIEAARVPQWDEAVDHLGFSFDGKPIQVPEGHLSEWKSSSDDMMVKVERTARWNSVLVSVEDIAEVSISVVPVTKEDDKVHKYRIPSDDCFAHLEVQFKFFKLSPEVEGVLGRTYQLGFENPAKRGVEMPIVGGEDKYQTSSLPSPDCKTCLFSSEQPNY